QASKETVGLLLASLGHPGAHIVPEDEAAGDVVAGHDLLICGVPEKKGILPPLPAEVKLSREKFAIDRETFSSPDDALFVVAGHPSDPARVTALFLPLSPAAADACVTKITHYGKYGYLVFEKGTNRKKGLLPAAGGGTVVSFR
ncbi:MAG TPA: M1 family peptidase, partial [Geobacteraceae bacterium]|nr:M1 family peptidase [Geobacteraceae bacterium]